MRLPSGKRASTMGLVSSTRRPTRPPNSLDDLNEGAAIIVEDHGRIAQRPWRSI